MARKTSNSEGRLQSYIERIEALQVERKALNEDIKQIFGEAKASGFAVKVMRNVLRIRAIDPTTFEEEMHLTNTYLRAVGMAEVDLSAVADL